MAIGGGISISKADSGSSSLVTSRADFGVTTDIWGPETCSNSRLSEVSYKKIKYAEEKSKSWYKFSNWKYLSWNETKKIMCWIQIHENVSICITD